MAISVKLVLLANSLFLFNGGEVGGSGVRFALVLDLRDGDVSANGLRS